MRRYKYIIGAVWSFYAPFALGQMDTISNDEHKNALKGKLQELVTLSASFEQQVMDEGEVIFEASGNINFARPGKMRWETLPPNDALMIADGTSIWNIDTFVEQVTIVDQTQTIANNPIILLTSENEKIWSQFDVKRIAIQEKTIFSSAILGYAIQSNDDEAQITELKIFFDDDSILGLYTLDAQGQESHLLFSDVSLSQTLPSELFEAIIPESYSIDDQR